MNFVSGRTIGFLCDVMNHAGCDPAPVLLAAGLSLDEPLPEKIPWETLVRLSDQMVRATGGREAEHTLLLRSAFLSILSHELRTPLNGIVGSAEVLSGTALSLEQRGVLDQLLASADEMASLLGDLLDLSLTTKMAVSRTIVPPPLHSREAAVATASDEARVSGTPSEHPRLPPRVLVVDDNATNRRVAVKLVERMGCEVFTAENGSEAVEAMRDSHYDLVLMDCVMPVMDGFDAARAIRELEQPTGRRTPIVAITANVLMNDRERCFAAGMDDFVSKPIRGAQIESLISRWCPRGDHSDLDDAEVETGT